MRSRSRRTPLSAQRKAASQEAEQVWRFLRWHHPKDAADRRTIIEDTVNALPRKCDRAKVYEALLVAVRTRREHDDRMRTMALGRAIAADQARVVRDIERA